MSEEQSFINLINRALKDVSYLQNSYLPIKQNSSLLKSCNDGVLLSYYIAWCLGVPCKVQKPKNTFEVGDLLNNVIKQAISGGIKLVNIGNADLEESYKLLLAFLKESSKHGLKRELVESSKRHAELLQRLGIVATNGDELICQYFNLTTLELVDDIDCKMILKKLRSVDCRYLTLKDTDDNSFEKIIVCCNQMGIEIGFSADDFNEEDLHYMICAIIVQKLISYPAINEEYLKSNVNYEISWATTFQALHLPVPFYTSTEEINDNELVAKYVILDHLLEQQESDNSLDEEEQAKHGKQSYKYYLIKAFEEHECAAATAQEMGEELDRAKVLVPWKFNDLENEVINKQVLKEVNLKFPKPMAELTIPLEDLQKYSCIKVFNQETMHECLEKEFGKFDDLYALLKQHEISDITPQMMEDDEEECSKLIIEKMLFQKCEDLKTIESFLQGQCQNIAISDASNMANSEVLKQHDQVTQRIASDYGNVEFYEEELAKIEEGFIDQYIAELNADDLIVRKIKAHDPVVYPVVAEKIIEKYVGNTGEILQFVGQQLEAGPSENMASDVENLLKFINIHHCVSAQVSEADEALLASLGDEELGKRGAILSGVAKQLGIALPCDKAVLLRNSQEQRQLMDIIVMQSVLEDKSKKVVDEQLAQQYPASGPGDQRFRQQIKSYICSQHEENLDAVIIGEQDFVARHYQSLVELYQYTGGLTREISQLLCCAEDEVCQRLNDISLSRLFSAERLKSEQHQLAAESVVLRYCACYLDDTSPASVERSIGEENATFAQMIRFAAMTPAQYGALSDDCRRVVCSELLSLYLMKQKKRLIKGAQYLLNRGKPRPLSQQPPLSSELAQLQRAELSDFLEKQLARQQLIPILLCCKRLLPQRYEDLLPVPINDVERYAQLMLEKLGVQEAFNLGTIGANSHLLLNLARRSKEAARTENFEQTMCELQKLNYDTLLVDGEQSKYELQSLITVILTPTQERIRHIMEVEAARGNNQSWNEYSTQSITEFQQMHNITVPHDRQLQSILVDLNFAELDEIDRRQKIEKQCLQEHFDINDITYDNIVEAVASKIPSVSRLNFLKDIHKLIPETTYFTLDKQKNKRYCEQLLCDIYTALVLQKQTPQLIQWADRVSKYAVSISNISSAQELDYRVIGQICGVVLCQNSPYYSLRESLQLMEQIGIPKFFSDEQYANKDPFTMRQIVAELEYKYDRLRSEMVYSNRFLRNYISFVTDNDAMEYACVQAVSGSTAEQLIAALQLQIAASELNNKNQVFLTLYIIDKYMESITPQPAHFVRLLPKRYGITVYMLHKIGVKDQVKLLQACVPQTGPKFDGFEGVDRQLYCLLEDIARNERIFVDHGNDYETSFVLNQIVSRAEIPDEKFIAEHGEITEELVKTLYNKRVPFYVKSAKIIAREGLQWRMFKELFYE